MPIQAKVLSTTQRFDSTTKPCFFSKPYLYLFGCTLAFLLPSHQRNRHQKPRISVAARSAATRILQLVGSKCFKKNGQIDKNDKEFQYSIFFN
ncbi:MAG: hypothetical protein ACK596_14200, partial [Pseudanabaena sp.]